MERCHKAEKLPVHGIWGEFVLGAQTVKESLQPAQVALQYHSADDRFQLRFSGDHAL